MKRFLLVVIISLAVSSANGQKVSTLKKDFNREGDSGDVKIVVIKSNEIPTAVQRSLSPRDSFKLAGNRTTIYTNPSNQVQVVHINNQTANQTYIYQKNSEVILMLRSPKSVASKPVGYANK